jgi:hypothetical protein
MNTLQLLTATEARGTLGGTDPNTGVTNTSSAAYDLAYLGGLIVGSIVGAFAAWSTVEPISVTEWKTGIREK